MMVVIYFASIDGVSSEYVYLIGYPYIFTNSAARDCFVPAVIITPYDDLGETGVDVTISTTSSHTVTRTLVTRKQVYLNLSYYRIMDDTGKKTEYGIEIISPVEIVVVAKIDALECATVRGSTSYLISPTKDLGTHHLVVVNCEVNSCVILIISNEDNNEIKIWTELTLTAGGVSRGTAAEVKYNGGVYTSGSRIEETLTNRDAMQILAERVDLTGT